jgi:CheY-like chemotaxis protein
MPNHLLIVDDDSINRRVARRLLELRGFRVSEASSGFEALRQLEEADFFAVLMDVSMPVMDGLETTRRIRMSANASKIPVIALTAHTSARDEALCFESGMNAFMAKPLDAKTADRLATVIRSIATSE